MRGSEDDNLKVLAGLSEALHCIRSHVDARLSNLSIGEFNLKEDIRLLSVRVINTMDQGLIQVEYGCFPDILVLGRW